MAMVKISTSFPNAMDAIVYYYVTSRKFELFSVPIVNLQLDLK